MRIPFVFLSLALVGPLASPAAEVPANAPALLELRDQFDMPQRLAFPGANVVVLTIADRKGSDQVAGWVAALKARYAGRIELRGLADVGGVPGLWRGKVRKHFQETRQHPVMMDWSGTNCTRFGAQRGVANLLVLARDGRVVSSQRGPASENALRTAYQAIDTALAGTATATGLPAGLPDRSLTRRKGPTESEVTTGR